jgi:hypothetical protein
LREYVFEANQYVPRAYQDVILTGTGYHLYSLPGLKHGKAARVQIIVMKDGENEPIENRAFNISANQWSEKVTRQRAGPDPAWSPLPHGRV